MLYIILLLLIPVLKAEVFSNNTLNYGNDKICGENGRSDLDFIGMAQCDGYTVEVHYAITVDGYILKLFRLSKNRLQYDKTKNAILLCHGLYLSADLWIVPGVNKSHPYFYVEKKFDVWLMNTRGNKHSRNHTTLNPNSTNSQFWNFDLIEMGQKDLPACVDYILKITGKPQVIYISHSQGVAMSLVLNSMNVQYNKKFEVIFGLSTTAYLHNCKMLLVMLQSLLDFPLRLLISLGLNAEIFAYGGFVQKTAEYLCGLSKVQYPFCLGALYTLFGYNGKEISSKVVKTAIKHETSGASLKLFQFWGYTKNFGFKQRDKGKEFPLNKITAPFFFIQAINDNVSTLIDMETLKSKFAPNVANSCILSSPLFLHVDFVIGKHNIEYCAAPIVGYLETGNFECK